MIYILTSQEEIENSLEDLKLENQELIKYIKNLQDVVESIQNYLL